MELIQLDFYPPNSFTAPLMQAYNDYIWILKPDRSQQPTKIEQKKSNWLNLLTVGGISSHITRKQTGFDFW